ncbi:MAG: M48 family metalloprotease [Desulfotalea sp.]
MPQSFQLKKVWLALLLFFKASFRNFIVFLVTFTFIFSCNIHSGYALSVKEEKKIGKQLIYSAGGYFSLVDDPDIYQYLNDLGQEVLGVAGPAANMFQFHFFVVASDQFNAFSAPSGLIFFYSGLISSMNSEDELVSVLAHEIGHSVKRHISARADKSKVGMLATAGLALAGILSGGALAPALIIAAVATGQSIALSYSRMHEEEADLLAYDWMRELNRDPVGQIKMLNTMRRVARYRSDAPPQYLITHPNPEYRLDYVESLIYMEKQNGGLRPIAKRDEFNFFRFKYRIMSQVKNNNSFRDLLVSQLNSDRSTEFQKKMARYGLALVSLNENDFKRAFEYLEQVMQDFPDKLILRADRGYFNLEAGRLYEASEDLNYVHRKNPKDLFVTFNLGRLMSMKGKFTKAETFYKSVLYDIPEYSKAYYELGRISSAKGRPGTASYYLGKYNLYRGKFKLAKFNFRQALAIESTPSEFKKESKAQITVITEILED